MNVRDTGLGIVLVQQATPCRLDPERQREDKCSKVATDSPDTRELLPSTLQTCHSPVCRTCWRFQDPYAAVIKYTQH